MIELLVVLYIAGFKERTKRKGLKVLFVSLLVVSIKSIRV